MGRAEKRKAERQERIENRKGKILITPEELNRIKQDITYRASGFSTEALMTCFALANRRLYKHGAGRIIKSLQYIDQLMDDILKDKVTIEDYKKELEDETGVVVECRG